MPEQMLTTTFRVLSLTSWQAEALETAATIYAEAVVALCRWAQDNLDWTQLRHENADAQAIRQRLPAPDSLYPPVTELHSCLRDDLLTDAASKVASYVQLLRAEEEGKVPERPGFWASRIREPPPWEQLLEEAIYRELLDEEEFLRWQGGLLSHGWLAKARRPQLGEQLLFLRVKGARGCHLLARQHNGTLQTAAVVYVGRHGLYPRLEIAQSAGWVDVATLTPYAIRSTSALYLPLLVESDYLRRWLIRGFTES